MANLSSIQLFSYENGAEVVIEWLNATVIDRTYCDERTKSWRLLDDYRLRFMDALEQPVKDRMKVVLGEYDTWETPLNSWLVKDDNRILTGTVRITSDRPISVMHHKLCPTGTKDGNGEDMLNYYWDGVFSAYCPKLFTRIARDCWISALEAHTTVHIWDYSDRNDEAVIELDRFEGWSYCRNPIFEQYGFDDDVVLISADKPISIVAGLQADQTFLQVYGKDGKDFHFPCFGEILVHAPDGASIKLDDPNGNQGSFEGTLDEGEFRSFDFKVSYKLRGYSSFEWATLRSSKPVRVYTISNSQWYLDEDYLDRMAGEEYLTVDKKVTTFYPHGLVPYPASKEFKVPLTGRAYVTVLNPGPEPTDVKVDFEELILPFESELGPHGTVTIEYSEDVYYYMDMVVSDTGHEQDPEWNLKDPHNRFMLDSLPHIAVDRGRRDEISLSEENITKGSLVKVKADSPVMVFINYDRDTVYNPQGMDLVPGLTPPKYRGLPDLVPGLVAFSGLALMVDMMAVACGRRSILDVVSGGSTTQRPQERPADQRPKPARGPV